MCTNGQISGPILECAVTTECAVLPNVNKEGVVQRCNQVSDTESRIRLGLLGLS